MYRTCEVCRRYNLENEEYSLMKRCNLYSNRSSLFLLEHGDTITSNDLVIKQYENLPYPEVNENELLNEKMYYKNEHEKPLQIYPSTLLEQMNHYLYQGKENFR